jgi:hypothetical protein
MSYLYQSSGIPAMQNLLYPTAQEAVSAPVARLGLTKDKQTGLIFNAEFNENIVAYDHNYQNNQSLSPHFKQHLESIVAIIEKWCNKGTDLIVDVGCGKGDFVELLRCRGFMAVGYDNAYQGESPYIRKLFFGGDSHEQGELLILRHVLEHIPKPWDFLASLADANGGRGYLYIEVPDLDWILENNAYFDLFHEHVNYFRLDDFRIMYGESLTYADKSFGGQYLSLVLDLACHAKKVKSPENHPPPPCSHTFTPKELFGKLKAREDSIYQELAMYDKIVIWGAAAKGVTFCCKAPSKIRQKIMFAVDINPSKQGMFMPISAVPVLAPHQGIPKLTSDSLVIIMNPNYVAEILQALPRSQPHLTLH